MFLPKNYISVNELRVITNTSAPHIHFLKQDKSETNDIIQYNTHYFLNRNAEVPKKYKQAINNHTFLNLTNKLPISVVSQEFNLSINNIYQVAFNYPDIIIDIINSYGIDYVVFSDEFVKKTESVIFYPCLKKELPELIKGNYIDGYKHLNKNSYLTWYNKPDVYIDNQVYDYNTGVFYEQ